MLFSLILLLSFSRCLSHSVSPLLSVSFFLFLSLSFPSPISLPFAHLPPLLQTLSFSYHFSGIPLEPLKMLTHKLGSDSPIYTSSFGSNALKFHQRALSYLPNPYHSLSFHDIQYYHYIITFFCLVTFCTPHRLSVIQRLCRLCSPLYS